MSLSSSCYFFSSSRKQNGLRFFFVAILLLCSNVIYSSGANHKDNSFSLETPLAMGKENYETLKIFSPIANLSYPQNSRVKVKTNFDKQPMWKSIKWSLNGIEFSPAEETGPFFLTLDHPGSWTLQGKLSQDETPSALVSQSEIQTDFQVIPIEFSLSPKRKILNLNNKSNLQIPFTMKIGKKQIAKAGKYCINMEMNQSASVSAVKWSFSCLPKGCINARESHNSFVENLIFQEPCSTTVVATITITLDNAMEMFLNNYPDCLNEFEPVVFDISAGRSDIWACRPVKIENLVGHFPKKGIAKAFRTFELKSYDLVLNTSVGESTYHFSQGAGLNPNIELQPAVAGVPGLKSSIVSLSWHTTPLTPGILEAPERIVLKPENPGFHSVRIGMSINFDDGVHMDIDGPNFEWEAVDLHSLVETAVTPASFTSTVGQVQMLQFYVKSLESSDPVPQPHRNENGIITMNILDGAYTFRIVQVSWSENGKLTEKNQDNEYRFLPQKPGKVDGCTQIHMQVEENYLK